MLDSGKCFWILGSVLDSGKCFWILGSVLDSGKCFVPMGHQNNLMKWHHPYQSKSMGLIWQTMVHTWPIYG